MIALLFCSFSSYGTNDQKVKVSLLSESKAIGGKSSLLLGLRVQLNPGWKTYWRSPGISGYGVNLTSEGSKNIKSIKLLWPLPHRIQTQLGQVNAYEGEVIFPLRVVVEDPTKPLHAVIQVDMLVCDEFNCLPIMEDLTLDLPTVSQSRSVDMEILHRAVHNLPESNLIQVDQTTPFQIKDVLLNGKDDIPPVLQIQLTKLTGKFLPNELPEIFIEIKDLYVDSPKAELSSDQTSVVYTAAVYQNEHRKSMNLPHLIGKSVTLTVGYQDKGYQIIRPISISKIELSYWFWMMLLAFIGGLILNIMPCVLPVLSLKILSILRHAGGDRKRVRQEFLATVVGIIFSFIILAGIAILFKITGQSVGWGIQFQDPYFIIALIGILTIFACNLFGFFEFRIPDVFSPMGLRSPRREKLIGSFLEGTLVTALATPCTAPFLGTAVAFALSRGSVEILTIFFVMGMGLASPFLIIAYFPIIATSLPKPGPWMIKLKILFGAILSGTAFWLLYVLVSEIGQLGAIIIAAFMLVISIVLKLVSNATEVRKRIAWAGAGLLISSSFMLPAFLNTSLSVVYRKSSLWRPFEPENIDKYLKDGKVVFVSVTADWCLTCQANKFLVLKSKAIKQALRDNNVVAMEANWTNHDPKITAYLKSFNQYGIPFYSIYGCKNPNGKFLGQIITEHMILKSLQENICRKEK